MMSMIDKVFIDSNIWLYALIQIKGDPEKSLKAKVCIDTADSIVISTQVVNEVCVNLMRKGNKDTAFINQFIHDFVSTYNVINQTKDDLISAVSIRHDYHFSYWDSLIIASALQSKCEVLYSEDMRHGLNIYNQLSICNPLL